MLVVFVFSSGSPTDMGAKFSDGKHAEFMQAANGAPGSAGRAGCLPRGKAPACDAIHQLGRKQSPAPTTAQKCRFNLMECRFASADGPEGGGGGWKVPCLQLL